MQKISFLLLISLSIWCCQTTSTIQDPISNTAPYAQFRSLAEALRLHPALQVTGSHGSEQITIRQFQGSLDGPLYVLNRHAIGNDYFRANQLINMAHVQSIRVIRSLGETVKYGSMGSSGVIEINTL